MGKRHLRSDFSELEIHFISMGTPIFGDGNSIAGLFRLIGKYSELLIFKTTNEISLYNPDEDTHFKYENLGYKIIGQIINENKENKDKISRKYLKNLSRKWKPQQVVLSFKSKEIINEILCYIKKHDDLKKAVLNYLHDDTEWASIMPIQHDFLSIRSINCRTDFMVAIDLLRLPDLKKELLK